MAEQIISASGVQHGLIVNPDGSLNIGSIVGGITIGSVSATVESIYVQSGDNVNLGTSWTDVGSIYDIETTPTSTNKFNPLTSIEYSGTVIGSIYQIKEGIGSFVKVLSYDGSDNLITVGSWVGL